MLEVLLLEHRELHLGEAARVGVAQQVVQRAQVVVRLVPVAGEHVRAERGRGRVLQVQPRLFHEEGGAAPARYSDHSMLCGYTPYSLCDKKLSKNLLLL